MRNVFEGAQTLSNFVAGAEQHRDMWRSIYARATVNDEILERARRLPARRHLLVLVEDWCGDGFNSVPWLARLADLVPEKLELRVLRRDEHLELMDRHLSRTGGRAIPVVMVLDENFEEIGWWGSRPAELQAWVDENGGSLTRDERYHQVRLWYARDRGVSTLTEVLAIAGAPEAEAAAV
ncbi:MAG TPA: thioredoxin family protein [Gemmatimonadaceae bacterium]|nr:thioredoxin family protein [Gemmatimonadaceae bacterium]